MMPAEYRLDARQASPADQQWNYQTRVCEITPVDKGIYEIRAGSSALAHKGAWPPQSSGTVVGGGPSLPRLDPGGIRGTPALVARLSLSVSVA
jgi:hypothetical protein